MSVIFYLRLSNSASMESAEMQNEDYISFILYILFDFEKQLYNIQN